MPGSDPVVETLLDCMDLLYQPVKSQVITFIGNVSICIHMTAEQMIHTCNSAAYAGFLFVSGDCQRILPLRKRQGEDFGPFIKADSILQWTYNYNFDRAVLIQTACKDRILLFSYLDNAAGYSRLAR